MLFFQLSRAVRTLPVALLIFFLIGFSNVSFSQDRIDKLAEPEGFFNSSSDIQGIGTVDTTFAPSFSFANGIANTAEEQTDGKLVVAGTFASVNGDTAKSIVRFNADRTIDTAFVTSIRGSISRLAIQSDGKIIIGGLFTAFTPSTFRTNVARLNADGSLDTSFDSGSGPSGNVRDLIIQPDGKVVIVGDFTGVNVTGQLYVARLNTDGSVDSTFTSPLAFQIPPITQSVGTVGRQSDGKIILGGTMYIMPNGSINRVLRLNTNGTVDNSFTSPAINGVPLSLSVQPDNKIMVAGGFTTVVGINRNRIARLNADGTHDTNFNPGTGANSTAFSARVLSGGKVIVSGAFASINGTPRGGLAILNADGSLDTTFAPSGTSVGSIVGVTPSTTGSYFAFGGFSRVSGVDRDTIVSVNADGSVDPAFVVTSLQTAVVRDTIVQSDGKMLVGGFFNRIGNTSTNSFIRLNSDGTLDPTFSSGTTITGTVKRIVVQTDGKLLLAGSGIRINNGATRTLQRLNSDGTLDASFTLATISLISIGNAAAVQADGKILFSYLTSSTDFPNNMGFVRLNSDGSIDSSFALSRFAFEAIEILANGQIIAAGPVGITYVNSTTGLNEPHMGVLRFNSDGAHDRTFQSAFVTDSTRFSEAHAIRVESDGKILVGGRLFIGASTAPAGVARLNPTGSVDGTFQTNSISSQFGSATVFALRPTADGKILAGGYFRSFGITSRQGIVRLGSDGAIDSTFSADTDDHVYSVKTEANGSVLVGGSFERIGGTPRTGFARLLTGPAQANAVQFDFDGDRKTDIGIYRPNGGSGSEWWLQRSSNGNNFAVQFGAPTDKIAAADYTGDGKTDIGFWRPSTGFWYVLRSEDLTFYAFPFGANGDTPVPADYDADGKADVAVFRESATTWYIQRSSDGGTTIQQFGAAGDVPVNADYDGDGKADIAIYRPSLGQWWLMRSSAGTVAYQFGASTDKTVVGDYTGDGKADVAFWRPSTGEWFVLRSEDNSFFAFPFGISTDTPVPGDYDGDGRNDAGVFRSSNNTWYIQRTTAGTLIQQFGSNGDLPLPNAYVR